MSEERFVFRDEHTDKEFGPFGRLATRDQALAHHTATGHFISVHEVRPDGSLAPSPVACCMNGAFLVEVPHDEEGYSLPCQPWIPGEAGELEDN